MLFSHKKIRELANLPKNITLDDIIEAINLIGFEVEEVKKFANVQGILFGKIKKITKNPNGDNLFVCLVEFKDKIRTIQTTAKNVFQGMIIIAFIPGSKIGNLTFKTKKIKGIISEGMLSSLNEFEIDKNLLWDKACEGIQNYQGYSIYDDPIEKLQLDDDLIDVSILTNRSDANSYIVLARELSAYFKTSLKKWKLNKPTFKSYLNVKKNHHKELVLIESKNKSLINIEDKILLIKNEIKIINDIVDLTNLTLIMTGQPTHAYDKKLVGKSFSTKYLNKKIKIFGNKEVELKNNLVITSDQKPVSLAGIIGFEKTSITNKTQEFILEFGQFKIKDIRNSLKNIKINSHAGFQSSKVISNGTLKYAIDYVKTKLNNFSEVVNFKEKPKKEIVFSKQKLNKITGFKITDEKKYKESINSLKKLGFEFKDQFVKIPTYRHDLESQQDINEEILRYYGYNLLPSIKNHNHFIEVTRINNIKKFLIAQGYYEVMTYSLISEQKNIYKPFDFKETIKLKTFVSKERELIRDSQIFSILEVIDYNQKNNIKDINIFSEGMVNNGVKTLILASTTKTFNLVKQDLVNLFSQKIEFKVSKNKNMHPGYSADIYLNNNKIGLIGKVNPKNSKIDAIIAEIYFEDYFLEIEYKKYDNNPLKSIDITFSLNLKENIEDKIKNIVAFNSKIIDATKIKNIKKVTVRFLGTQDQIKEINSKYNK